MSHCPCPRWSFTSFSLHPEKKIYLKSPPGISLASLPKHWFLASLWLQRKPKEHVVLRAPWTPLSLLLGFLLHYCTGCMMALGQQRMAERGSEKAVAWAESHSLELGAPLSSSWEKALLVFPHLQPSGGERMMVMHPVHDTSLLTAHLCCPATIPPACSGFLLPL